MAIAERTTEEKLLIGAFGETFEAMIHAPSLLSCTLQGYEGTETANPNHSPERFPWTMSTIESILRLPWGNDEWQEGANAPKTEAVSHLLIALSATMQPDTPAPDIGPMWDGGVCAEWHQNGVDLELYVASDGIVTWSFEDARTGEEQEEESGQQVWTLPVSKFRDYILRLGPTAVLTKA